MKIIKEILENIYELNLNYEISNDRIEKLQYEIDHAKVCTPIIGKFSSGKSALVNTLLGYSRDILKVDITPETAIPAEIVYTDSEDKIEIVKNDGIPFEIAIEEYSNYVVDATTAQCARVQLRNRFLEKIHDVMLVDMPGFESGYEVHNKAIDNYLPQSLAYIITFPADDMIVRRSVGNILRELCIYDMPLCVVITKYDKRNDDFDQTFLKMKENLKRFVGERDIHYCRTSSFTKDAEELKEFLIGIQEQSKTILFRKYKKVVCSILEMTESYLNTLLTNSQLSESQLNEQEEKLQKELSKLQSNFAKEKENFDSIMSEIMEQIETDVQMALQSQESTFISMILNRQTINEHLNSVVRNSVSLSIKNRFLPKVEKYLNKVTNLWKGEFIENVNVSFSFDVEKFNKGMTSSIVAAAAGFLIGTPILGIIVGIISGIIMQIRGSKKREEEKEKIRLKLNSEVFPKVMNEVRSGLKSSISEQLSLINQSVEEDIKLQTEILEKAMVDVRAKMNEEKEKKENLLACLKSDLEKIGQWKMQLQ